MKNINEKNDQEYLKLFNNHLKNYQQIFNQNIKVIPQTINNSDEKEI